ncbi:hypothetical protein PoB_004773500 [Plakobranchus ocellatus]|uniref:Uncharacterized protein n=1 Tax=Plakobranchus ocellatus TaxID=259542 RepID=A0AAV4BP38_9GAST|nr:hypothetical protein PoB_004773500 [Plakobranchus ocellatus]
MVTQLGFTESEKMPKLVFDPKGRYCWEANFNPVLRMSHNAIASVMFKMDVERAKYNTTIKRLDGDAKTELRITQREMEQVKRELQELKAYQKVAQMTAFYKFDPELKRRARAREEKERQRQLEDEEEQAARDLEALREQERDEIRKRLEKRQREEEGQRRGIDYSNMLILSRKQSIADGSDAELAAVQRHKRRLSSTGNVFVTLKDIVDNDNVLQRHSHDILNGRRPSKEMAPVREMSLSPSVPRHRGSNVMSTSTPDLSNTLEHIASRRGSREAFVSSPQQLEGRDCDGDAQEGESHVLNVLKSNRRRSRIGSINSLVQQVIQERSVSDNPITPGQYDECDTIEEKRPANVFITNIPEFEEETQIEKSACSPQNDQNIDSGKIALLKNSKNKEPTSQVSSDEDEANKVKKKPLQILKPITSTQSNRQGLFEILGQLQTKKNSTVEETELSSVGKEEHLSRDSDLTQARVPATTNKPNPLRGLARFKEIVSTVSKKNRDAKEDSVARIKKLTAAVIMANCSAQGKLPSAFMLHQLAPAFKNAARKRAPKLETVHKDPGSLRLRPLEMPKSVQRQHERKFKELMATINGAVHWKVRALRENTGTLNPRQLRRQKREQEREQQDQEDKQTEAQTSQQQQQQQQQQRQQGQQWQQQEQERRKLRPAVAVRPRRECLVLPGDCTTTWSLKKFVQREVKEVLASWQPENARKLRSQRLKGRMEDLDTLTRKNYRDALNLETKQIA